MKQNKLNKLNYTINEELLKKMHGNLDRKADIKILYRERERLIKELGKCSLDRDIKQIFKAWTENEYKLQDLWGFERNWQMHQGYKLPHCTCAKLDNDDMGFHYSISMDCPLHKDLILEIKK